MPTLTRRRVWTAVGLVVLVVVGGLLFLQYHGAALRQALAVKSTEDNAQRYTDAIVAALDRGPLTHDQLLAMRSTVYGGGGGREQGIDHVGERDRPQGVTVTFEVKVDFAGSFAQKVAIESCFWTSIWQGPAGAYSKLWKMDCSRLRPAAPANTVLALTT